MALGGSLAVCAVKVAVYHYGLVGGMVVLPPSSALPTFMLASLLCDYSTRFADNVTLTLEDGCRFHFFMLVFEKRSWRAGEMALQVRVLAALTQDWSSNSQYLCHTAPNHL